MSIRELKDIAHFAEMCRSTARLDGKTAIITGGNTGIGKETAIDLAKRGAKVVICSRNEEKAENAVKDIKEQSKSDNIRYYLMDLASLKSVRDAAANILENESRIDILINNAGIMESPFSKTVDGFESQMATNHLGHFLFTLLLLKRIREAEKPRIINVSSAAHRFAKIDFENMNGEKSYSSLACYGNSKLANVLFTKELAKRLKDTNVRVYCVHPGMVNTDLLTHISERKGLRECLTTSAIRKFGKNAIQGAQTSIHCAVDENVAEETGLYYVNCKTVNPSKAARDEELAKKIWDFSIDCVGLKDFNFI